MRNIFWLAGVIALQFFAVGFGPTLPDVPDNLKAPANEELILQAHATGVQIYTCQADTERMPAWILKAPEADLTDADGKKIIHHSAGPSWKHIDGSEMIGKLVTKQDSPTPGAIPWLLLSSASHTGEGILSRVTSIQRIHTEGGLPPKVTECTGGTNHHESRSAYSADYYFYATAKK